LWHKIRTLEDPKWTKRYHSHDPKEQAFGGRVDHFGPGEQPHDSVGEPGGQCGASIRGRDRSAACGDRRRKHGSEGDECPAEHGEHEQSQRIEPCALDAAFLGPRGHVRRHDGVEHHELRRRRWWP
jgi:hypothetical protein